MEGLLAGDAVHEVEAITTQEWLLLRILMVATIRVMDRNALTVAPSMANVDQNQIAKLQVLLDRSSDSYL